MTRVRRAAVAGSFYPSDPEELRATVEGLLDAADGAGAAHGAGIAEKRRPSKAMIVPHAGYAYSGPVAASAYVRLRGANGGVRRVVLLGPAHRVLLHGLATHGADAFETPLGPVPVERPSAWAHVPVHDAAHANEHSLEVQLPFLQTVLGPFRVVPVLVGDAAPEEVARALDGLWGGDETLVVVSSDLSHYLDAGTARRRDAATARAIVALDPDRVGDGDACGARAVCGLLLALRRRALRLECVDLRTSADTAGDPERVVGYGAFVTV